MNCQRLEEVVIDLARDNSLELIDLEQRESVLSHLAVCIECQQRLQDERALTRCLQEMAAQMKSLIAPAHLEAQLLESHREMISLRTISNATNQSSQAVNRWRRVALIAAVILIATIVGLRWYAAQPISQPERGPAQLAQNPQREPQFVGPVVEGTPNQTFPPTAERARPRRRLRLKNNARNSKREVLGTQATNNIEREVATHFMPIGFAGPINPQDGGELVRVELSRSAMLSLGLPVNMDRFAESVKADVLLGPDGLARAIRFVQ